MRPLSRELLAAFRRLRRRPLVPLLAIGILGVGVGLFVTVQAVVDVVLLAPPPFADPDRLVVIWAATVEADRHPVPAPEAAELRARARTLSAVSWVGGTEEAVVGGTDGTRVVQLARISPDLFETLGVRTVLGRRFRALDAVAPDTDDPPPAPVLVSYAFWTAELGRAEDVVGRALRVDGRDAIVAGVLPPGFRLTLPAAAGFSPVPELWTPIRVPLAELRREDRLRDQDSDNRGVVIARLAPGADLLEARAELRTIATRPSVSRGDDRPADTRLRVLPLAAESTATARPTLTALLGAVVLLLLLTSANAAALLLARTADRSAELAVRSALGASRRRLVALVVAEGVVIALAAGLLGSLVGLWGSDALLPRAPGAAGVPPGAVTRLAVFAAVATALAGVVTALLPALSVRSLTGRLVGDARSVGPARSFETYRRALVAGEIALAVVLLTGAGLLARSTANLLRVEPGFDRESAVAFDLALVDRAAYRGPADRGAAVRGLMERVSSIPGVASAGVIGGLPLGGEAFTQPWGLAGEVPASWSRRRANFRVVSDGTFEALGIRLLSGRVFGPGDDRQDRRVVVVDEALARRLVPSGDAVGRRIGIPLDGEAVEADVVGVVENVRFTDLRRRGLPTIYVPYRHEASRRITVVVRTRRGPPARLAPAIRRRVTEVDPGLTVMGFETLEAHVDRVTAASRFALSILLVFSCLGVLLAGVGLYALLAYAVSRRRREIGVRMALGASSRSAVSTVVRDGLRLAVIGIAVGLIAALGLARLLRSLLFGVGPGDPLTLALVAMFVLLTALAAAWIPARRAGSLDPASALRLD